MKTLGRGYITLIMSVHLFFATALFAEVKVTHYKNKATLKSSNCSELTHEMNALKSLSLSQTKNNSSSHSVYINNEGLCAVDTELLMPELFVDLNNKKATISGPNCWNFSFKYTKTVASIRYSSPTEVNNILNSEMCQQINPKLVKSGDLAFMVNESGEQVHSYVYISKNLLFAKNGKSSMQPFKLMTTDEMLRSYARNKKCELKNNYEDSCYNTTNFYRCDSFENYQLKIDLKNKAPQLYKLNGLLDKIESNFEDFVINPNFRIRSLPKDNIELSKKFIKISHLLNKLISLTNKLNDHKYSDQFLRNSLSTKDVDFIQTHFRERVFSLKSGAYQVLKSTSFKRNLDKTLFEKFKNKLTEFQQNADWMSEQNIKQIPFL